MTYKITYNKNACIGVGQCAAMSSKWTVNNKGKAELQGATEVSPGIFELLIEDASYQEHLQAANSCPVSAIKVEKVE